MNINNKWTSNMGNLEIGQSFETSSENYTTLRVTRSRMRKDGFDFQFKLGKGLITVKRIA